MIVSTLKLKNYMSFKQVNLDNLEPSKLYFLTGENLDLGGRNGIGKSALVESIVFSIYGKNIRVGSKDVKELISFGESELGSSILLTSQTNSLEVEIFRLRSRKKGQVRLLVNKEDKTQRTDTETNLLIEKSLLPFEKFFYTSYFNPQSVSFFALTPKQKLQVLEDLLNLEVLDELEALIKENYQQFQQEYSSLESEISKVQVNLENYKNLIPQYEADLVKVEEASKNLEVSVKERVELRLKDEITRFKSSYEELIQEKKQLEDRVKELEEKIKEYPSREELERNLQQVRQEISLYKHLYRELKELQDREICPTCKQPIDKKHIETLIKEKVGNPEITSISELLEHLKELENSEKYLSNSLNEASNLLRELDVLKSRISVLESSLSKLLAKTDERIKRFILNYDNSAYDELFEELYKEELSKSKQVLDSFLEQKKSIEERIEKIKEEVSKLEEELSSLLKKKELYEAQAKSFQVALKELSSTGSFRNLVLESYLKEIEESLNYMLSHLNKDATLKLYISGSGRNKGVQVSIFDRGIEKSYSQLSTGERRFVDMSLLLTFSAFSPVDFVLVDEALDSLSFENQVKVVSLLLALEKQVFLVTHNEKLVSELIDEDKVSQILITKENGISTVEVV